MQKHIYLEVLQDIAVSANGTVGTCKGLCLFFQNIFNFCVKCKNPFISERVCDRAVWAKCLEKKVFVKTSAHFSRISFFPLLAAILNFCVKRKNTLVRMLCCGYTSHQYVLGLVDFEL